MDRIPRSGLALAAAFIGLLDGIGTALAQAWPAKPITMVVPFAAGGPTDVAARIYAQKMSEVLGQPIVIENRGGAGGRTGIEGVARAAADGYTIAVANTATQSIIPNTIAKIGYDSITSFTHFGLIGTYPLVLVCNPKVPAANLKELLAHMKSNPGMTYGGPGGGGQAHFTGEYLKVKTGIDIRHVAYRGTGPVQADLISGAVDCSFDGGARELIAAGKVRAFAQTRGSRDPIYPDIPSFEEEGIKPFDLVVWLCIIGPAGIPADIAKKITDSVEAASNDKQVVEKMSGFGVVSGGGGPEALKAVTQRDLEVYGRIAREANLKFE